MKYPKTTIAFNRLQVVRRIRERLDKTGMFYEGWLDEVIEYEKYDDKLGEAICIEFDIPLGITEVFCSSIFDYTWSAVNLDEIIRHSEELAKSWPEFTVNEDDFYLDADPEERGVYEKKKRLWDEILRRHEGKNK